MHKVAWSLFLTGLFLGVGPCLATCGPLLVSYIAATKENMLGGLKTYIVFSVTRMAVYIAFGALAGFFGELVLQRFLESNSLKIIFFLFGLFLFFVGLLLVIEKSYFGARCNGLIHKYLGSKDTKSVVIFGLIVSFSPCLPLIAVLGYIALISDTWLKGIVYMGSFGLGTVISPMIFLSIGAGWLADVLKSHERVSIALKAVCGIILAYLGITLMLSTVRL